MSYQEMENYIKQGISKNPKSIPQTFVVLLDNKPVATYQLLEKAV